MLLAANQLSSDCAIYKVTAPVGVRQANRIRHAYLASVLQQEVAFFDTDTSSGKLLNGLNDDTVTVQNAIGEKVGNFVHHLATCLVGIAIGQTSPVHNLTVWLKFVDAKLVASMYVA